MLGASLLLQAVLQAASVVHLTVDDFSRYWTIANTLVAGGGYQVWEASAGTAQRGETGYWTDLPVLPLLKVVSFVLFGHTFTAAHVPLVLANIVLPFALYAAYCCLTGNRLWAYFCSALILVMPLFQIYTLGSSEPDPLLVLILVALLWRVAVLAKVNISNTSIYGLEWSVTRAPGCSHKPRSARGDRLRGASTSRSSVSCSFPLGSLVGARTGDPAGRWFRTCSVTSCPPAPASDAGRIGTGKHIG